MLTPMRARRHLETILGDFGKQIGVQFHYSAPGGRGCDQLQLLASRSRKIMRLTLPAGVLGNVRRRMRRGGDIHGR